MIPQQHQLVKEKFGKETGKQLTPIALIASLRRAMNDGDLTIADTVMLENKITEYTGKPGREAVKAIKQSLLIIYNRLST